MTDPDFAWPPLDHADALIREIARHVAADALRSFALDLAVGQPSHALISVGEVRHAAQMRAHRLDGDGRGCEPLSFTGKECANPAPLPHHCYSATAYVADAHDTSEGVQG